MTLLLPVAAALDPIGQFDIKSLVDLPYGLDFTNSAFFMVMSLVLVIGFFAMAASRKSLVPGRLQSLGELSYTFIADMIRGISGEEGLKFFPFVFTLFFFVLFANLIGMIPFFFTTTSHLAVTATLAIVVILTVAIYGFAKNGLGFLKLFAPAGAPLPVYFLLIPIEVISFLARPITLSLRLFANMLAGHIMLKLFAGFAVMLLSAASAVSVLAVFALIMGVAINALEFLVAGLQAFVFAILTCVYLQDAHHPSH
jgi:F-type H+-transporting ATPase subunit a